MGMMVLAWNHVGAAGHEHLVPPLPFLWMLEHLPESQRNSDTCGTGTCVGRGHTCAPCVRMEAQCTCRGHG